jgi:hypothetical protein
VISSVYSTPSYAQHGGYGPFHTGYGSRLGSSLGYGYRLGYGGSGYGTGGYSDASYGDTRYPWVQPVCQCTYR